MARDQLRFNLRPVVSEVFRKFIDRHAVDTRRALVLAYLFQCALQVGAFNAMDGVYAENAGAIFCRAPALATLGVELTRIRWILQP